ncbi:MAG: signal peptidase II [Verrucomicrobia bacterium]|nr:signal peptidase II [Verrucomicrobiota bacterium]
MNASRPLSFPLLFVVVTLPLYLLDQATKWIVLWTIPFHLNAQNIIRRDVATLWQGMPAVPPNYDVHFTVIPEFFDLVHWRNFGAAFSFMSDKNGHSNAFFIGLSAVALVVLAVLAWRGKFKDRLSRLGWALLLAGILGNLTDRIYQGSVVDFLLFDLHVPFANPWPAFNVADSCIFFAAALFILQSFRESRNGAEPSGK